MFVSSLIFVNCFLLVICYICGKKGYGVCNSYHDIKNKGRYPYARNFEANGVIEYCEDHSA